MVACVMIGDSIAVGVGMARPECQTIAKVGISSERYVTTLLPAGQMRVDTAVISLGVNDDSSLDTLANLRDVRSHVDGRTVYWLLPNLKPQVREMIKTVAEENGDRMIDTRGHTGPDHLHPTGSGYQLLASRTMGDAGDTAAAEEVALDEPRTPHIASRHHGPVLLTPTARIRRLRELRQAEGPIRTSQLHHSAKPPATRVASLTHAPVLAAHPHACTHACPAKPRSLRG